MIGWKLIYVAVAAVVYIILISVFFNIEISSGKECSYMPCVRFCQSNRSVISDYDLIKKFKESSLYRDTYYFDDDSNLTIYREELKCKEAKKLDVDGLRSVNNF